MKANLMYTMTICFLVFSGTNFISTAKYLLQMQDVIFGGDLTLRLLDPEITTVLDEFKIRDLLDTQLVENGGNVEAYTLLSANMRRQFNTAGREQVKEYVLGTGMIAS